MPAVAGSLCCAGTPWGHTKVSGALGNSMPRGVPWLFWVLLLGTTMGTVVSGHFKLDFKSQVGFKKPIQFSSLGGTDLLAGRLRKGPADLLWVPPVRPKARLGPQPHLPAYARLVQGSAWSFLCRELSDRYRVAFSLFFCLSPCIEEDGDHHLPSQEEKTGLSRGLGFSYYVPSYHLPLPPFSQAQETASASAKDSLIIPSHLI